MPFLRRRGHTPSESDLRRLQKKNPASTSQDPTPPVPPVPPVPAIQDPADDAASPNLQSRASSASQRPDTPPVQEQSSRHKRFSVLKFRNASDSQLSVRARQQAEKPPPIPRPPEIITTAPTGEFAIPKKRPSRINLAKLRRSHEQPREDRTSSSSSSQPQPLKSSMRKSSTDERASRPSLAPLEEPVSPRLSTSTAAASNASSGAPTSLTNRPSESSRSDASSIDRNATQSPITTPKKSPHSNSFFKMRRSKKTPEPFFPLSHLPQKDKSIFPSASSTSLGVGPTTRPSSVHSGKMGRSQTERGDLGRSPASVLFAPNGSKSGQSSPTRPQFLRERSNTQSTMGRDSTDDHLVLPNTRTSSSTGRKSFGDLLGLSRRRQNSELSRHGTLTPATPGSITSKSNSLQLAREAVSIILPERRDDESPAKYLARVEDELNRGVIAAALSKGSDPFSAAVLRSYMRSFGFFGDPMDMAIRKLLMEAELPKETQHIDRCLQSFANRYHECNPGIYASPEQAYFVAFSLLILHTDVFNKNNKHKMQKPDYLKNTHEEGIYDDILECFYDNITYTPFIYVEDEPDIRGDRAAKLTKSKSKAGDPARRAQKEPIDPYTLIIDNKLDALRPNLKDTMQLEEHYNYLGTATSLNLKDLQKTFFRTGVLQIISARSRPDAFRDDKTKANPEDAQAGLVDIKVTKVGLLWRKDPKKRKTRSPWQEWGAILTGAQLYFFRNTTWIKNLMNQYESHIKAGNDGEPIIFRPPLEEFKPDALMSTQGAVALHSIEYKKHKHAFVYVRTGRLDEILLADNEDEMNDWLAKLNYAAAFRTSGVRMRGVGDAQGRRGVKRLDTPEATQLIDTPIGQVSIARGLMDHKMAEDILTARRDFMKQKIEEAEEKIHTTQKKLDEQLRNARHLQILAPIQPRTREHLLEAAKRISADLKWTRMEMWKEKCHRDILQQDREEEFPEPSPDVTPIKSKHDRTSHDRDSSPTPRPPARNESKLKKSVHRLSRTPVELEVDIVASPEEKGEAAESPFDQDFSTPPQSAAIKPNGVRDISHSRSNSASARQGSVPSIASSSVQSSEQVVSSHEREGSQPPDRPSQDQDEIDAEERDFLRQAGLLEPESKSQKDVSDKATASTAGDGDEKFEKNKVRRSLHRTLREGAGHLSHHRSKKGREITPVGSSDDARQESQLPRVAGSFTVHGKKASVINFGTGLENMSTEEKIRARKQSMVADRPLSPALSNGDDDDFYSVAGDLPEDDEPLESRDPRGDSRRESAASESTATARSFRELHRKYSSAQAARSVSSGGRLAIPSDAESDALSFSDGRRSPLPPMDDEAEEEEASSVRGKSSIHSNTGKENQAVRKGIDDFEEKEEHSDTDEKSERLASPPVQAVNA